MSRLLVISHTPHYLNDEGLIVGWGSTVRELDYLSGAFGELEHLAPLYTEPAPKSALPYHNTNVKFIPLTPAGGKKIMQKLSIILNYPRYLFAIHKAVAKADFVQVRCPCNIAIVALFYLTIKSNTLGWAKYAGNWRQSRPPISYRLQKWWLAKNFHRGPVTINGNWYGRPDHLHSFHNPCLTLREVQEAKELAKPKALERPIRLLFVGSLNESKGIGRALEIVAGLHDKGEKLQFDVVGNGPNIKNYELKAIALKIEEITQFHGWQSRDILASFYLRAHFLILPSISEGFPKVISEAMAYGAIPVAGAVSGIPQVLKETGAGIAVDPKNTKGFMRAITHFINNPKEMQHTAEAGIKASVLFTYENYLSKLERMFCEAWGISPIKKYYGNQPR